MSIILQAASEVLANAGAGRFTTARVAERAGVSVGSVYQYFPNKAAILFRLQSDEWTRTADRLSAILADSTQSPDARLRAWVHAFIASECEEAAVRLLTDAAPGYREMPGAGQSREAIGHALETFMADSLPREAAETRTQRRADTVDTQRRRQAILDGAAHACADPGLCRLLADIFCAYLDAMSRRGVTGR
ncbi:TetR family transcriptional regulator [Achromobacter insuavis]